jgi:hypothetical protein
MEERGRAFVTSSIATDQSDGHIEVERGGGTVYFNPDAFRNVHNNQDVYFKRFDDKPDWAEEVRPVNTSESLLILARPPAGLSRNVQTYLRSQVGDLVRNIHTAKTVDLAEQHKRYAEDVMHTIAKIKPTTRLRVGVRAVHDVLDAAKRDRVTAIRASHKPNTDQ